MKIWLCLSLGVFCWCIYAGSMQMEAALQAADEAADLREEAES